MDNMYDLVQALRNCGGECSNAEDSLSDVEGSSRDAADAAESATERVRDIESVLDDAIELAEKLQNQEEQGTISKEDVKIFILQELAVTEGDRQRLLAWAQKLDIDLTHEVK